MQRWDPLSERQLLLLKRIGDGDDLSNVEGVSYRISTRSLQTRGLVHISRRGGVWRAQITDAGRFYIDQGATIRTTPTDFTKLRAESPTQASDPRTGLARWQRQATGLERGLVQRQALYRNGPRS